jgi:hypothetical protein
MLKLLFAKIKKAMGFATHGLLVSSIIFWFYEFPKNDGRRRLCERQRRASPKRRDRIVMPMFAPAITAVMKVNPFAIFPRCPPADHEALAELLSNSNPESCQAFS